MTSEDELARARDALAGRAEIAARLAHELRGPVSTLRGLAGTTLAHYEGLSDDERREFIGLIRHEAERLEALVEQVAIALRLDAGTLRLDLRPGRLDELVAVALVGAEVGDHAVSSELAPVEASADATTIRLVVRQLVENAAAFSPPGSPIAVRLRRDGDDAVLEVEDRGPGIPADRRDAVFERFADWRPAGYEDRPGAGLGLFITREVARAHGGDAWAAVGSAKGTMLTVRIPLAGRRAGGT